MRKALFLLSIISAATFLDTTAANALKHLKNRTERAERGTVVEGPTKKRRHAKDPEKLRLLQEKYPQLNDPATNGCIRNYAW